MASVKGIEFEEMGGNQMLKKISNILYERIYEDPWLKLYFAEIPQEHIERQQVAFMQAALGGPNLYCGQTPPAAHKHMNITDELYAARQIHLDHAFRESGAKANLIEKWQKIDDAFFSRIVKKTPDECVKRYNTDQILDFPKP